MALGFSGSNGGITANQKRISAYDLQYEPPLLNPEA